ncbi:MAG: cupin domain-containing protein, partial [Clostridia bacterium]|nr:cupin domain-containing protein [Clostridia bacterium]
GFASYNDNGEETIVGPGDVMYVRAGQSHAIGNPFKEPAVARPRSACRPPRPPRDKFCTRSAFPAHARRYARDSGAAAVHGRARPD